LRKQFSRAFHQDSSNYAAVVILTSILFLFLPLAYWPELYEAASLPRYFLIGLVTSTSLLLWIISNRGGQVTWQPGFALILAFLGWAALSTSWSPDPGTSLIDIMQLFSMIMLAFLAMQMSSSPAFLTYLVPAILAGAAVAASIGLGQYLGFNPLGLRTLLNTTPATFINPNHAAVYFDFIPWLALATILFYQHNLLRWLAAVSLGLCLAYISVNTSRGSLLAFSVSGLIFMVLLRFKPEMRTWLKARGFPCYKEIALAILIPLLFHLLPILLPSIGENVEQWDTTLLEGKLDPSAKYRYGMYLNSLPAILENPFTGLGYGGMRVGFLPYSSRLEPIESRTEDSVLRELHSDPLQYFVELGLPGGLLAIAIFFILVRRGWKTLSFTAMPEISALSLGFMLSLIAGATHAMVDFPLRLPTSAAMFWLYAGILLGLDTTYHVRLTGKSFRPLILLIGIAGVLFSVLFYRSYFIANHDLYQTVVKLQKGECLAAAKASEQGLETFASDFMLLTAHAQVYSVCTFPPDQKLEAMNRVLRLDPTNMRARLTRGDLYNRANKPHLAMADFEKITHALPHRPYAYAGLGDAARLQGDQLKARHYYLAALKRKPDYNYAKNKLMALESTARQRH
jgi:O-antigen ligase